MKPDARLSLKTGHVALFASDMHLGDHDPDTAAQFLSSLDTQLRAHRFTHLFLLGDIFEAWVGDDQPDSIAAALGQALVRLSADGLHVMLMRGNRDFLLGVEREDLEPWPQAHGALLLDEPTVIDLFGERVLLSHGDAWCTDDHAYQRFRAEVRSIDWQTAFLAKPLAERLGIARAMREQSERNKLMQSISDVTDSAASQALRASGATRIIHGHTHRPGVYALGSAALAGQPPAQRWVLPDWLSQAGRGGFLRVDHTGWHWLAA